MEKKWLLTFWICKKPQRGILKPIIKVKQEKTTLNRTYYKQKIDYVIYIKTLHKLESSMLHSCLSRLRPLITDVNVKLHQ